MRRVLPLNYSSIDVRNKRGHTAIAITAENFLSNALHVKHLCSISKDAYCK